MLLGGLWFRCWPRRVLRPGSSAITPSNEHWSHEAHPHRGSQDGFEATDSLMPPST